MHRGTGNEIADVDDPTTDGALISLPSEEPSSDSAHPPRPTTRSRRPPPTRIPATMVEVDTCAAAKERLSQRPKNRRGLSQSSTSSGLLSENPDSKKDRYERLFVCSWEAHENINVVQHRRLCVSVLGASVASRVRKYFGKFKPFLYADIITYV